MITNSQGNLLNEPVEALVNTVNTKGVMGKGIALQFKKAYPQMFKDYAEASKRGEVVLGRMHVWPTQTFDNPQFIINFPTKGHWKSASRVEDIDSGLEDLIHVIQRFNILSIAVPPLGCGNGGLRWEEVEPRIRAAFAQIPDVDVRLFAPAGTPSSANIRNSSPKPRMTTGRAALVGIIDRYMKASLDEASLVEVQKLMYFMQELGEPLKLNYQKNRYGPYADNLRHVLNAVEGHYLIGYGDGAARVFDAEGLRPLPGATKLAFQELEGHPETNERMNSVLELVQGFESAYGLELLATVHWIATKSSSDVSVASVEEQIAAWSDRKSRMFTSEHIRRSLEALKSYGLVA